MDHHLGGIELIRWQGRRNRRARSGVSLWTVIVVLCALVGCSTLAGQAFGLLPWSGPLAALPAVLVLLVVGAQIMAFARAAIAWLVG